MRARWIPPGCARSATNALRRALHSFSSSGVACARAGQAARSMGARGTNSRGATGAPLARECRDRKTGNCTKGPADDGGVVQCVGPWAKEKHDYIRRYIDATREVREKYLRPGWPGACYIDLYAGPGLARVGETD